MNVKVSVIVNCFNGEKYLKRALNSLLEQTYRHFEVIFYDNCSSDNSLAIFSSFSECDSRFKLFSSESHVSLGEARKFALDYCEGDYVSFLDVDDIWVPDKLEKQIFQMICENADVSYTSYYEIVLDSDVATKEISIKPSTDYFKLNLNKFQVCLPTLMLSREFTKKVGINFDSNLRVSEEFCLTLFLIAAGAKVMVLENFYSCYYSVRSNSLSVVGMKYWSIDRLYTLNLLCEKYKDFCSNYSKELNNARDKATYYDCLYNYMSKNYHESFKIIKIIKFKKLVYFVIYILLFFRLNYILNVIIRMKYGYRFSNIL